MCQDFTSRQKVGLYQHKLGGEQKVQGNQSLASWRKKRRESVSSGKHLGKGFMGELQVNSLCLKIVCLKNM